VRRTALAVGLIASFAVSCNSTPPSSQNGGSAIVIASDLPTAGLIDADVVPLREAIALAIKDRGSLDGYPLVYEPFDDALVGSWNPIKGEQNARIMVGQAPILAVIGPYNSQVALFDIPVTNEAGLVMISPSNTLDCLTSVAAPCVERSSTVNNYFRVAATDSAEASAAALFAIGKLKVKNFAVLTDGSGIGTPLADAFAGELSAAGGVAVFRATYTASLNDYTPLLRQARAAGADGVFVGGLDFTGACRIRAAMSGVFPADAYMLASDYITDPSCAPDAGTGANDHLLAMVAVAQPASTSKVFQEFRAHGIQPTTYAFAAYDCAQILIDAIRRAMDANGGKLPNRREVLDAVAATRGFVGATGTFTFLPSGDPMNPGFSVYRIQNGNWSYWENA
jgi:branched-chain amino acid transport system substrate-binding protein